jgi:acetyltransferase-like isoleucine patch superfamily enzyme
MKVILAFRYIFGLPKSIYVNFKLLSFSQAIRLPIIVSTKTKLSSLKVKAIIHTKPKLGLIRIGFGSIRLLDYHYNRTILHVDGTIEFFGKTKIGQGSRIEIAPQGILQLGKEFTVSGGTKIICSKQISFADKCLVSWDTLFMDTDQHNIYDIHTNEVINKDKPIAIGNKVWIGNKATILKGSIVADNSIIGAASLVTSTFKDTHVIIAGHPAKIIKTNIRW